MRQGHEDADEGRQPRAFEVRVAHNVGDYPVGVPTDQAPVESFG